MEEIHNQTFSSVHDVSAEAPLNAYALDMEKLSKLIGCSQVEFRQNVHAKEAVHLQGVVVDNGQDVPFEEIGRQEFTSHAPEMTHTNIIKQVLLTAAYRPIEQQHTFNTPKCLLRIGGGTIIQHILNQLYLTKIERVVISVALKGDEIIKNVRESPLFDKMNIEFVDLGEDYREGHARSILAMKSVFHGQPFMLHTADHIFDHSILAKMLSFRLLSSAACVLVETDFEGIVGTLPSTAVKIKLSGAYVDHIGRTVDPYDGIDAGLFVVTSALFDALEELAKMKSYFSLSEALDVFASEQLLRYLPTNGDIWFSFETEEQLAYSQDHRGDAILSPWMVFLVHSPKKYFKIDGPSKNLVLGLSSLEHDTSLRIIKEEGVRNKVFSGFAVNVEHVEGNSLEISPLLLNEQVPVNKQSFLPGESNIHSDPTLLSISLPEIDANQYINKHHAALLLELSDHQTNNEGSNKYMLAVPDESHCRTARRSSFPALPTDVTGLHLETKGVNDDIQVTAVIDRSVPVVGYLLLVSALFAVSSVGVGMDMQIGVPPLLKLFWRMFGTMVAFFPVAGMSILQVGLPTLSRMELATLLLCSFSYAVFNAFFLMALELTSVGHAYIFSNTHSILIVFGKFLFGRHVAILEGIGAMISLLGGITTTFDSQNSIKEAHIIASTATGDLIALLAAIAGVFYLINAKALRSILELPVFMFLLTFFGSTLLIIVIMFTLPNVSVYNDINTGLFGWINTVPTRLPLELYLVLFCSFVGTMGFVSVLKYFDPIVVSVVMLTEPIVATVLGILVGVSCLPGIFTYVGGFFVILGTILVIYSAKAKTEEVDCTKAIQSNASNKDTLRHSYGTSN